MDRVLLIILSLLIFSSCTKQGSTPTKIQVSTVALVGAIDVLEQNLGGLYIYGFGPNGARFGKVLSENSFNETLPNGTWSFYVVGWEGGDSLELSGQARCGSSKNVKLNGTEVNLSLTITTSQCSGSDFSNNMAMNVHPILNKNVFPYVMFESCKAFPQSPSNGGDPSNLCVYDMSDLSIPRLKGYFSSIQVIVPSFMKASSSASASFSIDEELTSVCLPISETQIGGVDDEFIMASLNLPVGTSSTPFPFKVRGFYGNTECTLDSKGFKEFTLLNGRQENSDTVKAIPVALLESTTTAGRIYLTSTDAEVCAQLPLLSSGEFSGGNGSQGLPYLICNNNQFNLINDDLVSYYRLVSDLDFQFGMNDNEFVPIGAGIQDSANSNTTYFSGVFDGNRHKMENIYLGVRTEDLAGGFDDLGVFRQVEDAKILDLRIENTSIECHSDTYAKKCNNTGILVGEAINTTFKNIYIKGHLVGGDNVGVIAGKISLPSGTTFVSQIQNSFVEAAVDSRCPSSQCYNYGGLVGDSTSTNVLNSSARVSIHGEDLVSLGGLIGRAVNTKIISSSSFGDIGGISYVGGLAGTFIFNNYGSGFAFTSEVTDSFSHAYVFARQEGGAPVAGALVAICIDSVLPITGSYHAVGKAFANNDLKGLYGNNTGVDYVFSAQVSPLNSSASCTSANEECLANSSDFKDISWLNTNLGGNFVNTTSAAFEILEVDDKNEYPRHKWESQIESILGYKIPFLERKCSGKLGYDSPDAEGQGTETNPYIICSTAQLQGSLWGNSSKYFKLMRDLDFENSGPELGDDGVLGAKFDGNYFNFKNVQIQSDAPRGMWQTIASTGVLKNLKIKHSQFFASNSISPADTLETNNFGFVAAINYGVIENTIFESASIDIRGWIFTDFDINNNDVVTKVNLGSLVGINDGTIIGSRAQGRLDFFDLYNNDLAHYDNLTVGSLAGINKGIITQSFGRFEFETFSISNSMDFEMDNTNDSVVIGGLVGLNDEDGTITESQSEFKMQISNNTNDGLGTYSYGGIAGRNAGLIENIFSYDVKATFISSGESAANSFAGGVAGINTTTGKIKKSIASVSLFSSLNAGSVGGIVGQNSISVENAVFVSNNMCVQEAGLSAYYSSSSYSGDEYLTDLCLSHPITISTSGSTIQFTDNFSSQSLSNMSFEMGENPNSSSAIWLIKPFSNEIELRATKNWFDDI